MRFDQNTDQGIWIQGAGNKAVNMLLTALFEITSLSRNHLSLWETDVDAPLWEILTEAMNQETPTNSVNKEVRDTFYLSLFISTCCALSLLKNQISLLC